MSHLNDFVHLHVHTDYSLLDGACHVDRLCSRAYDLGMPALAITDHGNMFGVISFFKAAKKYNIKPLLGCEIYLMYGKSLTDRSRHKYNHMGVLAQNYEGYLNMVKLVSESHVEGFYYKPRTDMERLARHSKGLIGFTGCLQGVVPQFLLNDDYAKAREAMGRFVDIFGKDRFFVELQDHGIDLQQKIIPGLLKLADEFGLKVICSNDVHYVNNADWAPHDALLCIQTGSRLADEKRLRYTARQFYLKDYHEMKKLFGERMDSLTNTLAVAEMCDVQIPFGANHYPVFSRPIEVAAQHPDNKAYIKHLCKEGLKERYGLDYDNPEAFIPKEGQPEDLAQILTDRLDYELATIEKAGFLDYFLIVWDFIDWARKQKIPVGPGRGSGAGCIVAYLLRITDIDPIRFSLLFERFLNPDRVSPPDFDIDFCMRRRVKVIEYVREKYGHDCVANIITFGTFGAKMVIRDLARVNDIPYADADRIAKMIPDDPGISLSASMERSQELKTEIKQNAVFADIINQGKVIEGMVRNTGTHAAGVIISDKPLTDLVPVTLQDGVLTTQYPKDPVEDLGLLKMDFLGLKTLTVIADAQDNVREVRNLPDFDVEQLGFEDEKTFELLNEAKTVGVFQLESGGMQSLCRQFSISNIDEIVALIALYRPGPMDLIPDYIRGKKDPSKIKYPHALLEDVCRETYGIMVYQEQVMEAAKRIAGYSLGEADILRRAMGKKKVEEMERQRAVFIEGAQKNNGIRKNKAEEIFNLLEKFAGYGFNKSHSAAYAVLSYRTAFLKANYPIEFMAAVLSSELGNADKVAHFTHECSAMGLSVLGPDINESNAAFTPIVDLETNEGSIRFGLAAIKGVGDAPSANIIAERKQGGNYLNFIDFVKRIDPKSTNKRVLECLIKVGAFDAFEDDRAHLLESVESVLSQVSSEQKDKAKGQGSLFDLMDDDQNSGVEVQISTQTEPMELNQKLNYEKELLGFYVSGHPMKEYSGFEDAINTFDAQCFEKLENYETFRMMGVVSALTKKISKRDNRPWAFMSIVDMVSSYQVNVFADAFEQYSRYLEEGAVVIVEGTARNKDGEVRLTGNRVFPARSRISSIVTKILWVLDPSKDIDSLLAEMAKFVHNREGNCTIQLGFKEGESQIRLFEIAGSLRCSLCMETFQKWRQHPGVIGMRLDVAPIEEMETRRFKKSYN